jgi:hypothetical protein
MAAELDGRAEAARQDAAKAAEDAAKAAAEAKAHPLAVRVLSFTNLMVLSIVHSILFTGLMLCAFLLGKPQPATFIFGFTHGVLYMVTVALVVVAAKLRTISITTALVVGIMGAIGPYFGTYEFLREWRKKRRAGAPVDEPPAAPA